MILLDGTASVLEANVLEFRVTDDKNARARTDQINSARASIFDWPGAGGRTGRPIAGSYLDSCLSKVHECGFKDWDNKHLIGTTSLVPIGVIS